eukprot:COSAG04_NODE_6112_length_1407_cov_7.259174_2_plen_186_part_01
MQFPGAEDSAGGKPDDKQKKVGLSDVYNVDSKVLRGLQKYNEQTDQADFLFAAEQGGKNHRPWGEKMTFYTGCGVLCGGTMGAVYGAYDGIKNAKGSSQRIVINSVANQVGMWGSITGDNAFGHPFLGAQGVGGFQKTVLLPVCRLWKRRGIRGWEKGEGRAPLRGPRCNSGTPSQVLASSRPDQD